LKRQIVEKDSIIGRNYDVINGKNREIESMQGMRIGAEN